MHRGVRDGVAFDQLTAAIDLHMVLVAVVTRAVLFRPARVHVLLAGLGRLLLPLLRHRARLDGGVVFARIGLPRHLDQGGIHHLPLAGKHAPGFERRVQAGKQGFDALVFRQRFAERPKGFLIRRRLRLAQPEEALETVPVGDLKLRLRIAELVEALDDARLEHHRGSKRGPATQALRFSFWEPPEDRVKQGPVYHLVEPCQRVTHGVQFLQARGLVKEAAFIGLHILAHRAL